MSEQAWTEADRPSPARQEGRIWVLCADAERRHRLAEALAAIDADRVVSADDPARLRGLGARDVVVLAPPPPARPEGGALETLQRSLHPAAVVLYDQGDPAWLSAAPLAIQGRLTDADLADARKLAAVLSISAARARALNSLRLARQRYELAMTATRDGVWDWHVRTRRFWMSDHFYDLLGYPRGSLEPNVDSWKALLHPDDADAFWQALQRYVDSAGPEDAFLLEHRLRTHDGEYRWFLTRGKAVLGAGGRVLRVVGSISDIHDRKRMEDELTRSEERYFLAVRGAGVGLWDWDIETGELYWSDRFKRMLGVSASAFQPKFEFMLERVHPEDRPAFEAALKAHLEEEARFDIQCRMRHEQGHDVWIHARGQAIWGDDGKATRMAGSVADITEVKKAEQEKVNMEVQLRHAQKLEAIGQLAAGIAHEINTPIQFVGDNTRFFKDAFEDIKGLLEDQQALLEAVERGEGAAEAAARLRERIEAIDLPYLLEEIPQAIEQSLDGVRRVADIVKAMKEFSHPGSASKELSDLNKNILNTITVSRNEWKYVADLETDLDPDLPQVECLPNELNQVILNMIVNAAHAIADVVKDSGEKGKITIRTRADGDHCEITISDTGKGIAPEHRDRIFDPFFTTKEVGKGTGQGLAIAYSVVVDKHGGRIDVDSEVGRGTTFRIRIPLRAESTKQMPRRADETTAVRG
ncbi:MAG: hypothetical protein KatS3mg121_1485 [Gammaproteobacteria bacterium]|nr:MAG: hypothetical protein KatS3mg121_1485 [Gammaproteobacteria bacterium]